MNIKYSLRFCSINKWINQYQKVNCIHEENVFEVYDTLVDHWMYVHVQYTKKAYLLIQQVSASKCIRIIACIGYWSNIHTNECG